MDQYSFLITYYLLKFYVLLITCYVLIITYYLFFINHHLPFITKYLYLSRIIYYLLLITYHFKQPAGSSSQQPAASKQHFYSSIVVAKATMVSLRGYCKVDALACGKWIPTKTKMQAQSVDLGLRTWNLLAPARWET